MIFEGVGLVAKFPGQSFEALKHKMEKESKDFEPEMYKEKP